MSILSSMLDENGELKKEIKEDMEIYFEKLAIKEDIMYKRAQKLRQYLSERNLDDFIGRIIREHDDDFVDRCYQKGYEPYPNNKFDLLLKLVEIEGDEIESIDFKDTMMFPNEVIKYENYYFQWIHGQGTIIRIYDERHEEIFQV